MAGQVVVLAWSSMRAMPSQLTRRHHNSRSPAPCTSHPSMEMHFLTSLLGEKNLPSMSLPSPMCSTRPSQHLPRCDDIFTCAARGLRTGSAQLGTKHQGPGPLSEFAHH